MIDEEAAATLLIIICDQPHLMHLQKAAESCDGVDDDAWRIMMDKPIVSIHRGRNIVEQSLW
jgi:hypothetical protein